jgi:hypothetical protein
MKAPVHARAHRSSVGGAPVVTAAHSSCIEKPAPTGWVLRYAALVLVE